MILNPVKLLGQNRVYPGVSLNIPPHFQIEKIKDAFPEKKRVGIFFGPERNQATVEVFSQEGNKLGIEIVKFPISSAKDISAIINSKEFSIDVLLIIPDEQLGSTRIVEYVIKESLRRKVPVVGYNSWFAKNGALLSFVIDYRDVGMQTGKLAKKMLLEEGPLPDIGIVPPEKIKTSVDLKTAKKLGVKISPAIIQQAHEVIK
jgi:putative ABC transport system substrate-binding protein